MVGRSCRFLLAIAVLILAPAIANGQTRRGSSREFVTPPSDVGTPPTPDLRRRLPVSPVGPAHGTIAFPVMTRAAGVIFSGTVTSVSRQAAAAGQAVETVAITFHVENAIRGATAGEDLTISQWIGLWSGGQRYRIGEHVLLFLYPPSKLRLTSCVGGEMGRFRIDASGRVLLSAQHLSAFRTDPVLGGKSRVRFGDFALAVRRASEEE
jgi:hypothetical protein